MNRYLSKNLPIDRLDRRILSELQDSGRLTNAELAERIALSPSACHRRVARLEEQGIIAAYRAILAPRAAGLGTTVFVEIALTGQSDEVMTAFEKAVRLVPAVTECHLMAGKADYLLRVHGDSMKDAGILDNDLLAVHSTQHAENGQIVVARIDDEVTVKRFQRRGSVVAGLIHVRAVQTQGPNRAQMAVLAGHIKRSASVESDFIHISLALAQLTNLRRKVLFTCMTQTPTI